MRRVGWADVQSSVAAIGGWYVPILVLGGLRFASRAAAWAVCARPEQLLLPNAFRAALVGDALGNLTPLGVLASEPAKVLLVRDRIPVITAVASVAAENAFYMVSVVLMIAAGAVVFFGIAQVPPALALIARVTLAGAVGAGFIGVWIARQQPAVLTRLAGIVAAMTGQAATTRDRLREIEVHFYALLRWPLSRIAHVFLWEAAFHVGAVAEVFLVLKVMSSGATLVQAFVLETTGRLIVVVFKFVPYRLGVDEAGTALVARALALDPAVGVTLALVRRIRILIWNGVGLVLLAARR